MLFARSMYIKRWAPLPESALSGAGQLNCLNGTIDLRTGELKPYNPDNLITKLAPVHYDPDAQCPIWEGFLQRAMANNQGLITFLQRALGYALTGNVSEQVIFIFHGGGANGKSTFLIIIMDLLGDYATKATSDLLMVKRGEVHPTETAPKSSGIRRRG